MISKIARQTLIALLFSTSTLVVGQEGYLQYHRTIVSVESLLVKNQFEEAILKLDSLAAEVDFMFLRECKLGTELATYHNDFEIAFRFLEKGILAGWTLKSLKKKQQLISLQQNPKWSVMEESYDSLHLIYLAKLNKPLRQQVRSMLKQDQKMALKAWLRIGDKSQIRYAEEKFAPHSEQQLAELRQIIVKNGYPGEKIIGNSWWASVFLSHHNSISPAYTLQDTLYPAIRPYLQEAILKGELHPYDFAIIEDWLVAASSGHDNTSYGYLGKLTDEEKVNENRKKIGLRSIDLRNALIDLEAETGLNLYLQKDWQKGKISPK